MFHFTSVRTFKDYLEPEFHQICHEDIGRVPMIPGHTLRQARERPFDIEIVHNRRDVEIMLDVFAAMFLDERFPPSVTAEIESSDDVFTCSICDSVIWNGHVQCTKCSDFDLCLRCFICGRSCKFHYAEYSFKQLMTDTACEDLVKAAEERLGRRTQSEKPRYAQRRLFPALFTLMTVKGFSRRTRSKDCGRPTKHPTHGKDNISSQRGHICFMSLLLAPAI